MKTAVAPNLGRICTQLLSFSAKSCSSSFDFLKIIFNFEKMFKILTTKNHSAKQYYNKATLCVDYAMEQRIKPNLCNYKKLDGRTFKIKERQTL